ncbi:hypothetical protein B0H14DRAFT_3881610 [Mycena olivaceomarginata]|nr:hypothetical protein B0H14DRAFT_3881610 [Mycena olivaceomarginata]
MIPDPPGEKSQAHGPTGDKLVRPFSETLGPDLVSHPLPALHRPFRSSYAPSSRPEEFWKLQRWFICGILSSLALHTWCVRFGSARAASPPLALPWLMSAHRLRHFPQLPHPHIHPQFAASRLPGAPVALDLAPHLLPALHRPFCGSYLPSTLVMCFS